MEKLEVTVESTPVDADAEKLETKNAYDTGYEGLELRSDKVYGSGTSMKYWM